MYDYKGKKAISASGTTPKRGRDSLELSPFHEQAIQPLNTRSVQKEDRAWWWRRQVNVERENEERTPG